MLKNLFKTAIRHILKHAGYSILNILGLTLGITSALFLIIYVADEVSYDRSHEKADRIYRVSSTIKEPDDQFTWIVAFIPQNTGSDTVYSISNYDNLYADCIQTIKLSEDNGPG